MNRDQMMAELTEREFEEPFPENHIEDVWNYTEDLNAVSKYYGMYSDSMVQKPIC